MKSLTLSEIAALTGGTLIGPDLEIRHYETDSRVPMEPATLFVALKGPNFDGHEFVENAAQNGVEAALVKRGFSTEGLEISVIEVDEPLLALQAIAAAWRARFRRAVVGITGSNGKTIVKEMLAAILSHSFTVYRSPGSFNSQVGVALSVLGIRPEHEVAIIEAGISEPGEMERLEKIIKPTAGIFTSIGPAHLAGLGSLKNIAEEKLTLFEYMNGSLILANDVPSYAEPPSRPQVWTVNDSESATIWASEVTPVTKGFTFTAHVDEDVFEARINVPGVHNVHNALCAAAMALELGADIEDVQLGLASYELAPMRLEMHTTSSGITLINDAYSSDPVSARAALSALSFYAGGARTLAVLGDMLELGESGKEMHRSLGGNLPSMGIDKLICVGELAKSIGRGARDAGMSENDVHYCPDLNDLPALLDSLIEPGDFLLFKGSRRIGLEVAAQALVESMAPTRLYIDLDAIRQNVRALRKRLGPATQLMAVVKSFAYGNDATRVSQTLVREGVDALAVAYPDEAIPLRLRGINVPILVTNALAGEADKIVKYDLIAQVYSKDVVEALSAEAGKRDARVQVHLEVDTGMNRVGLRPDEVSAFAKWAAEVPNIDITGAMTHFAVADEADRDEVTLGQIAAFEHVLRDLEELDIELETVHAANTAAAWRFPQARYDMVRVGLGLYGYHPSTAVKAEATDTQTALRFVTQVIHVKSVATNAGVSYGLTGTSDHERRIATIAAGYNDGFPRFLSNVGEVLIGGKRCSVVGSVCMDVCMVDVTDVPDVSVGDEVVLFGEQGNESLSVEDIADIGNTINYEILCKISPRVRRIFMREI